MLTSDTPTRNKILVVGRRGVGKLSLVQSVLGSRFVPTTSASKSRPSSPLILPAIPVPTLEDTVLASAEGLGHLTATPPNGEHADVQNAHSVLSQGTFNHSSNLQPTTATPSVLGEMTRLRQDHSGVTIPWTIDTKYYSVQVDFWIDETESQGIAELERMIEAGDLDEMGTVVEAVVFCFSKNQPSTFHDIKPWLTFVERHEPSITLCVATDAPMHELSGTNHSPETSSADNEYIEDYDDWCLGNGFEYIDLQEHPEDMTQDEHVGLDRIMEALAAHMWDGLKRKSNKKRDQHERSMMMSFQDDDVDMGDVGSFPSLSDQSRFYNDQDHNVDDDDEEDDDDEDDDRAFYKALAELNLQARPQSPSGMGQRTFTKQGMNILKETPVPTGFDDDFDEHLERALSSVDLEDDVWSSQESSTSPSQTRGSSVKVSGRRLERQFKQYLGQPSGDETFSSTDTGGIDSSGELSYDDAEYSFELDNGQDFEFGDFVVNHGPGGEDLEDIDFSFGAADGMSTPKQESIKTMHDALFSNIDGDEGMAQTIAILQGLREQGRNMAENERRQLAARVALSFGMQMGE